MLVNEDFSEANKHMHNESLPTEGPIVIPVIEETAHVDKQVVTTGKIRIEKKVEETNEAVNVDLLRDEYTIKRVAINKYVDDETPQVRHEGNTLIIPVLKEVVVKRLLLVEEVHILKEEAISHEQINIPLRKEIINITRLSDNDQQPA